MRWLLQGIVMITFLFGSIGCAMQTDRKGAEETRPAPTRVDYPTKEIPSKYVNDTRTRTSPTPTRSYQVRAADRIVHAVTGLREIRSASAVIMGNRAYVAVALNQRVGNAKLTDNLKKKIADRARDVEPGIKRVYVSANPDFAKQLDQYADEIRAGRPVQGLINRLTDLVNRTFPEAK
ncbi:YhcN/YlaJ family sporulation lipoprotein [Thermoflavimicrobium dichotomicum]|uniref:Sporulation lipoprotein, YhcN/YlaJ family n=1 Tax=Thermoflavimicrobium dichotomicum TaxID=46223 RepID=A0A1I3NFB1_9BACL|nr:YhcN/YlaJ family sporulation lipoprotein [Thermoflavimicrobium dichotomicum]SFJ07827.1 sporulation lipoprotein, YhcN/YlaJ family [Thermoflavimicrobium dichotomicum]